MRQLLAHYVATLSFQAGLDLRNSAYCQSRRSGLVEEWLDDVDRNWTCCCIPSITATVGSHQNHAIHLELRHPDIMWLNDLRGIDTNIIIDE